MVESRKLPPVFPELTMKGIILEWYQELLREHGESRWPEFGGPGLLRWYMSQQNPVIDISLMPATAIPSPCSPYLLLLLPAVKQHLTVFLRISPAPYFFETG